MISLSHVLTIKYILSLNFKLFHVHTIFINQKVSWFSFLSSLYVLITSLSTHHSLKKPSKKCISTSSCQSSALLSFSCFCFRWLFLLLALLLLSFRLFALCSALLCSLRCQVKLVFWSHFALLISFQVAVQLDFVLGFSLFAFLLLSIVSCIYCCLHFCLLL